MCQTFYLEHANCTCIHVLKTFSPCAAYVIAHREDLIWESNPFGNPKETSPERDPFADPKESSTEADPFVDLEDPENPFADPDPKASFVTLDSNPKLLTDACEGLDFSYENTDIMSLDVNSTRAPNGLECSAGITARHADRAGHESMPCLLCDRPEVMEIVDEMRKYKDEKKAKDEGKGKGMGKVKGLFHKSAKSGSAAFKSLKSKASGGSKKGENGSGEDPAIGQKESPKPKKKLVQKMRESPEDREGSMDRDLWRGPVMPFYC